VKKSELTEAQKIWRKLVADFIVDGNQELLDGFGSNRRGWTNLADKLAEKGTDKWNKRPDEDFNVPEVNFESAKKFNEWLPNLNACDNCGNPVFYDAQCADLCDSCFEKTDPRDNPVVFDKKLNELIEQLKSGQKSDDALTGDDKKLLFDILEAVKSGHNDENYRTWTSLWEQKQSQELEAEEQKIREENNLTDAATFVAQNRPAWTEPFDRETYEANWEKELQESGLNWNRGRIIISVGQDFMSNRQAQQELGKVLGNIPNCPIKVRGWGSEPDAYGIPNNSSLSFDCYWANTLDKTDLIDKVNEALITYRNTGLVVPKTATEPAIVSGFIKNDRIVGKARLYSINLNG